MQAYVIDARTREGCFKRMLWRETTFNEAKDEASDLSDRFPYCRITVTEDRTDKVVHEIKPEKFYAKVK